MDLSKNYFNAKEARAAADNSNSTLNDILTKIRETSMQNKTSLTGYPLYGISEVAKKNILEALEELGYKVFKSHYSVNDLDSFNEITVEW